MINTILGIIGSILIMVIGLWRYLARKNTEKRKQAEQAKKDMENAKKEDGNSSDFLDSFGRLR